VGTSVRFELQPKQMDFLAADEEEVMYSGGFGGGKTLMVCLKAFIRAQHPRAVEVLARAKDKDVQDTILPTLFEGSGKTPAILQPGTYVWNKAQKWIRLLGRNQVPLGLIRYRGLGASRQNSLEKMGFRGQNVTGVGIDQAEEITLLQYNNVLGRTRVSGDGLSRQVYGSANPSAPSHWIAQRFGIKTSHEPQTTPHIRSEIVLQGLRNKLLAILTCPAENPHLPPDYMARLATYTGVERLRYVLGRWVASEGAVYNNFLREIHAKERSGPWCRALVAVDDGTSVPAALLLLLVDAKGRRHYAEECHRAGMTDAEKVARVVDWNHKYGPLEAVVVDPAAASLKLSLSRVGLPVFDGRNDRKPGISVVRSGLERGVDGAPGWTISPKCERTISEIEGYMWDPDATDEKPIKRDDHGPDAIRYGEMHLYSPPALVFSVKRELDEHASRIKPVWAGHLSHAHPPGRMQDASLAMGKFQDVMLERDSAGPLVMWKSPKRSHRASIIIFGSVGHGERKSHLVIGDHRTKEIVGEFSAVMPPETLARVAAMLALHFASDEAAAGIGFYGNSPGRVFEQHLQRLTYGGTRWQPNNKDFAEAIGVLRSAWETGQIVEPSAEVLVTARQYVYAGESVMHASLVGDTEQRGGYSDGVIARAGLWWMISGQEFEDIDPPEPPPGSMAYLRKREEERARGRLM